MPDTQALADKWEKHNGATVTLDGIQCKLRVTQCRAFYPVVRQVFRVEAVPTATGKRSVEFMRRDANHNGPWTMDVLESDKWVQTTILKQLG
jgi:hypothetical protein